ncbi:hypothetical protein LTR84_003320 [Exophiala bonariae]|uniref:DUF3074 domain-containing protein n=1 Tax=Exophiala bonariae TaxID=1690606 RepID=A0AAV9NAB1_9EURO|nr:hypothetical protein LTR84_003320 [Exophiala bonariae]
MARQHSNLIRMAPLQLGDLPAHPVLPLSKNARPEVSTFVRALLDDGIAFLDPSTFNQTFSHHSTKTSGPSAAPVEILTHTIPASEISQITWSSSDQPITRSKPRTCGPENWAARRSIHADISSKNASQPGHASWDEFVFGLRDSHSVRELEFTPSLYDARLIVDWGEEVAALAGRGNGEELGPYTQPTMAIYEMCHVIPGPMMSPRCFPVLVATASVDADRFVAVTVPVNLSAAGFDEAFYSSDRNVKEGTTATQRREVIAGVYTAVELVTRNPQKKEVEWIMATASDAKGNLPGWMQKAGVPSQIAKDVGYFMQWISTVEVGEGDTRKPETPVASGQV